MERNRKNKSNDQFECIIDLIPFGMLLINHKHEIEYYNEKFADILGHDGRKFTTLSQWLNAAFPENDYRRQVRGILLHELPYAQTGAKRTYAANVTTSAGLEKMIRFTSLHAENESFLWLCEDITRQRKKEEQFQHVQKMEAIGSVAGGVAHEFNNLLMGIQGYVSLMMLDTPPSHKNYSMLQAIEAQIKSGADLTGLLLERARSGRLEFKTVDLNDFISGIAAHFRQSRREIRLSEKYAAYTWAVEADTVRLAEVLQIILANAARLLFDAGIMSIETDNLMLEQPVASLHGVKPGPYVRISLTLPNAKMDELTRRELFSATLGFKDGSPSAGPDLSFAYGMIKSHGGTIEVENNDTLGTVFHIYLPASSKTPHKKKADAPPAKHRTGRERILLVDDEKVITDVTGAMLSALGYDVIVASDGEEAVAIYRQRGRDIDLVVMDVVMPGMGGGEAIDLIRTMNPSVKVILCSGYSMDGAVKAIMDKGVQTFLKKPFRMSEFSQVIRNELDGQASNVSSIP